MITTREELVASKRRLPPPARITPPAHEVAILGGLLSDPVRCWPVVEASGVSREHFQDPALRKIARVLFDAHERRGCRDSLVTLLTPLKDIGAYDEAETAVDSYPGVPELLRADVRDLIANAARRRLVLEGRDLLAALETYDKDTPARVRALREAVERAEADVVESERPEDGSVYASETPPEPDPVLSGLFDAADKVLICASSKARKTFFLLMLSLLLAAGRRDFLGIGIPKRRRVLFINLEIKESHFWRRVYRMTRNLGIDPEELRGHLHVVHARGRRGFGPDAIMRAAKSTKAEVVIIDPVYKLLTGDENAAADVKPILAAFDALCERLGAAVVYSHHEKKGRAGDRDARDRGAGSGVIARDYDAALYLAEHAAMEDGFVLSFIARNYAPRPPCSIVWDAGHFVLSDAAPVELTTRGMRYGTPAARVESGAIVERVERSGPFTATDIVEAIRELGASKAAARNAYRTLVSKGTLAVWREPAAHGVTWIGTPGQIGRKRAEGGQTSESAAGTSGKAGS